MSITVRSAIDSGNVPGRIDDSSGGSLLRTRARTVDINGSEGRIAALRGCRGRSQPRR